MSFHGHLKVCLNSTFLKHSYLEPHILHTVMYLEPQLCHVVTNLEPQLSHAVTHLEPQLSHAVTYFKLRISHLTLLWPQNCANNIFDTYFKFN